MMRRISAIQLPALILLFCAIAPGLVAQRQTEQPEKTGPTQCQRQGFLDYALGKINPSNTDYGTAMANGRSDLVGHTIDDLYFWSNAVTLGLLVCSAGIIYFEWRSAVKKEIVAATIIAASATESKSCAARSSSTNWPNGITLKLRAPSWRSNYPIKRWSQRRRISKTQSMPSHGWLTQGTKMLPEVRQMYRVRVWLIPYLRGIAQ
jgi:hypothetical protein